MVKGIKIYIVFLKDYLKYFLFNIKVKKIYYCILNFLVIILKFLVIFDKFLFVFIIDFVLIFMKKIGSNFRNIVLRFLIGI